MDPQDVLYAIAAILFTIGTLVILAGLHKLSHANDVLAGHDQQTVTDPSTGETTQPIRGRW